MRKLNYLARALSVAVLFAIPAVGMAMSVFHGSDTPTLGDTGLTLIGLGGMIINKDNLDAMYQGFKTSFTKGFTGVTPMWNKVATLVPSSTKTENYGWLSEWPKLREWIGDRQIKNLAASGYSITNKKFESSVGIPRDDVDDDSYGIFSPLFEEMGYAANTHPDELVFGLMAAGFATECFDGQYFFDTDHPVGAGTVSNFGGGSGDAWFLLDTRRPLKPLIFQKRRDYALKAMTGPEDEGVFMRDEYRYGVDARCNVGFGFWQMAYASKNTLDDAAFDAAVQAMMEFKSDEGRPLGVTPNILAVGPSNRAKAKAVIDAENRAAGESNTNYKAVEVMVCPWLA